jgi:alkaline phosphatase D
VPPRTAGPVVESALRTLNRHVRWVEVDSHGSSVLEVTPAAAQMAWYFLANKADPSSALSHARYYRVRAGTQRVQRVGSPIGA